MKRFLSILAGVVILIIAILVLIPLFVDPNDHKETIAQKVYEQTGRKLALNGDMNLSLFPWVGVTIDQAALGNPAGFKEATMVSFNQVNVRVKMMPLLSSKVEVDKVVVDGLEAHLIRRADGSDNWSQWGAKGATSSSSSAAAADSSSDAAASSGGGQAGLAGLTLSGVEVTAAKVVFRDEQAGMEARIDPLDLTTGALAMGEPVDLRLHANVAQKSLKGDGQALDGKISFSAQLRPEADFKKMVVAGMKLVIESAAQGLPVAKLHTAFSGDLNVDLDAGTLSLPNSKIAIDADGKDGLGLDKMRAALQGPVKVRLDPLHVGLDNLNLVLQGSGKQLPGGQADMALSAKVMANLAAGNVQVDNLNLEGLGKQLKASGSVSLKDLNKAMTAAWQLKVDPFSPKGLMKQLGMQPLQTADAKVLTHVGMDMAGSLATAGAGSMKLSKLALTLDDTHLNGTVSLPKLDGTAARFDLKGDKLNLDRYAMQGSGEQKAATTEGGSATAGKADENAPFMDEAMMAQLRKLDIKGSVVLDELKAAKGTFEKVTVKVNAKDGVLKMDPFSVNLYKGSMVAKSEMDLRGSEPKFKIFKQLKGVQAGPMLKEMADFKMITGKAEMKFTGDTRGLTPKSLKRHLNGNLNASFADGTLEGLDIVNKVKSAYALAMGKSAPAAEGDGTAFDTMLMNARIKEGVVQHDRLRISAKGLSIDGKGTADIATEEIDYDLKANVSGLGKKPVGVPVKVSGNWNSPKVKVNTAKLVEAAAKEKLKGKLQEKLQDKLGGKGGAAGELLKNLPIKLF
uniref:Putative AsmA family protein n=1 Tax=Magnetococcus massalia (strain MO-1) TaxID=451514 RepID=A0A1S7LNS9_MAGMO|nr:putative AsmA family protein [Candidatus Magnetococcus massalia]